MAAPLVALLIAATLPIAAAPPAGEKVSLDELLDRAAWYLDYFVDEFENVVAEESYIQDSSTPLLSFSPTPGGRGGAFRHRRRRPTLRAPGTAIYGLISCS